MLAETRVVRILAEVRASTCRKHGAAFGDAYPGALDGAPAQFRQTCEASLGAVVLYSEWLEGHRNHFNAVGRAALGPLRRRRSPDAVAAAAVEAVHGYATAANRTLEQMLRFVSCVERESPSEKAPEATIAALADNPVRAALQRLIENRELEYVRDFVRHRDRQTLLRPEPSEGRNGLWIDGFPRASGLWAPKPVNNFVGFEWQQQVDRYAEVCEAMLRQLGEDDAYGG